MRIFVLGAGRMGAWLTEALSLNHEVAAYDTDRRKLQNLSGVRRLIEPSGVKAFQPELMINAVTLSHIREAFSEVLPFLREDCMLADIASVKTGVHELYQKMGRRFVSTHPMFGPAFADIGDLCNKNAIIIEESDEGGKEFFRDFYRSFDVTSYEYTFEEHDKSMAYSLSIPFASSLLFAACMKKQDAPGTTFRKHLDIASRLLSQDDHLLAEVLFNPHTINQMEKISSRLAYLTHIIKARDFEEMKSFLDKLRNNIG